MDCRSFNRNIEDYLEGGLDFSGRFGMDRHADQCYVCRRELGDAERVRQAARGLQKIAAPPDFEAAVLARIHARPQAHFAGFREFWLTGLEGLSRRLTFAAAALAFMAVGIAAGRLIWSRQHPGERPADVVTVSPSSQAPAVQERLPATAEATNAQVQEPERVTQQRAYLPAPRSRQIARKPIIDASDPDYFEYLLPGPDDRELIMRLPRTIRMRYGPPSEEYFIRNVSH